MQLGGVLDAPHPVELRCVQPLCALHTCQVRLLTDEGVPSGVGGAGGLAVHVELTIAPRTATAAAAAVKKEADEKGSQAVPDTAAAAGLSIMATGSCWLGIALHPKGSPTAVNSCCSAPAMYTANPIRACIAAVENGHGRQPLLA